MNQELELILGTDFRTLDAKLEETPLADIAEKLILISKKLHGEHTRIEEANRTLSELALFDRKASLLTQHIVYANRIRDKLQSGYQHLVNVESQLLTGGTDGLQLTSSESRETPKSKSEIESKKSDPDRKSLRSLKSNHASGDKAKQSKQSELLSNLVDLEQKEFVVCLQKILGADISLLDWKRILALYCVVKQPLKSESIKCLSSSIPTKPVKQELDAFGALLRLVEQRNQVKFVALSSLIAKARANKLDESRYPTVNWLTESPAKLLIFVTGGISFNELNLVKTSPNTTLISDCILYPKNFFLDGLLA